MAFITRTGTTVLHPRAARMAITMTYSMTNPTAVEFSVYGRVSVRGEQFAEPGDTLMVSQSYYRDDWAFALNLVTGESKVVNWDDLAHSGRPKEATL